MMASNPAGHPVEQQVLTQISRHWPGGESTGKLNVALSGGGDSTALLVATTRIIGSASERALHANHIVDLTIGPPTAKIFAHRYRWNQ